MKPNHTIPINRDAARVIKPGEHYIPHKKIMNVHRSTPLKVQKPIPKSIRNNKGFSDLTGSRRGRLTVLGMSADDLTLWVCRCDCGRYTTRKAKAIKNPNNEQDRCEECRQLAYLKREEIWRRTGKNVNITQF